MKLPPRRWVMVGVSKRRQDQHPSNWLTGCKRFENADKGVEQAYPYVCQVDRFLKPRLAFLTEPPFVQLVALICIAAALVSFPLGLIPFGPVLPGVTVLLFGLALTARDGFVLILAGLGLAGSCYLMIRLWERLVG